MKVKELRNKVGVSQQELADATGIPKSRIAQWEAGKASPKTHDTDTLINYFIEKGVLEPEKQKYVEYDMGAAIKKMEAISEVSLSVLAEVLAKVSDRSATAVLDEIRELVNKRLNS